jgi:hypothetical protein
VIQSMTCEAVLKTYCDAAGCLSKMLKTRNVKLLNGVIFSTIKSTLFRIRIFASLTWTPVHCTYYEKYSECH